MPVQLENPIVDAIPLVTSFTLFCDVKAPEPTPLVLLLYISVAPASGLFVTIKLNALSDVLLPAVALAVNETVVSPLTSVGSPDITPDELFNANPEPVTFVPPVSV